jgi:hypothetical protein
MLRRSCSDSFLDLPQQTNRTTSTHFRIYEMAPKKQEKKDLESVYTFKQMFSNLPPPPIVHKYSDGTSTVHLLKGHRVGCGYCGKVCKNGGGAWEKHLLICNSLNPTKVSKYLFSEFLSFWNLELRNFRNSEIFEIRKSQPTLNHICRLSAYLQNSFGFQKEGRNPRLSNRN